MTHKCRWRFKGKEISLNSTLRGIESLLHQRFAGGYEQAFTLINWVVSWLRFLQICISCFVARETLWWKLKLWYWFSFWLESTGWYQFIRRMLLQIICKLKLRRNPNLIDFAQSLFHPSWTATPHRSRWIWTTLISRFLLLKRNTLNHYISRWFLRLDRHIWLLSRQGLLLVSALASFEQFHLWHIHWTW